MTTDQMLDQILIPRPNGSEGLERVAAFLASTLESHGADVILHSFTATPYGFQLTWLAALLLMLGYFAAIARRRYRVALVVALLTPALLLMEFELLWSPISGLLSQTESNVVGTFPGRLGGPTLIFCAHYDTTTHFGDHRSWGRWGWRLGPAVGLALALAGAGLWRAERDRGLARVVALPAAALALVPFAAMTWFHGVGPVLRTPSPGALDNGGSVVALLRLAERLASRPAGTLTTVRLVFLAAEEERALGSRAYASTLERGTSLAVVNLESVGAAGWLGYVPEDGFALRRYHTPAALVDLVADLARTESGAPLPALELPEGTLTDARSFLAQGIPAVTLRASESGGFPRNLHSWRDSRERLSVASIESTVDLLAALVRASDDDPSLLEPLRRASAPGS